MFIIQRGAGQPAPQISPDGVHQPSLHVMSDAAWQLSLVQAKDRHQQGLYGKWYLKSDC